MKCRRRTRQRYLRQRKPIRAASKLELLEPRIVLAAPSPAVPLTPTEQLGLLYSGLNTLDDFGDRLQQLVDSAAPVPELLGRSFVDRPLTSVASLSSLLRDFANQINQPPQITFADGLSNTFPTFNSIASAFDLFVLIDGDESHQVRVEAFTTTAALPQDRALAWQSHLNGALVGAGLANRMEWTLVDPDNEQVPALSLLALPDSKIESLTVTTARIDATQAGPPLGQLTAAADLEVRLTLSTLVGNSQEQTAPIPTQIVIPATGDDPVPVRVVAGSTSEGGPPTSQDNVVLDDLASDLNEAFKLAQVQYPNPEFAGANNGQAEDPFPDPDPTTGAPASPTITRSLATYLEAIVVPARGATPTHLAIVARHADVVGFDLSGPGLTMLGFVPNPGETKLSVQESALPSFSRLRVQGAGATGGVDRDLADRVANEQTSFATAVGEIFAMLGIPYTYSEQDKIVRFSVDMGHAFSDSIGVDLDRTLDLGALGNVDLSGRITADADASTSGQLTFEIVLADSVSGSDGLTEGSPLAELDGGKGAMLAVGIAAEKLPLEKMPNGNSALTMRLKIDNQSDPSQTIELTIPRNGSGALSVDANDLLAALQEALRTATVVGGNASPLDLRSRIEARMFSGRIHLRALDRTISGLEIVGNLPATRLLGFSPAQKSSDRPVQHELPTSDNSTAYPDLEIRLAKDGGTVSYFVSLDGETTLRGALQAITAQTPKEVDAQFENGAVVLYSSDPISVAPVKSYGILSGAALALRIAGGSLLDATTGKHVLRGTPLSSVPVTERVFIVPSASDKEVGFQLGLTAGAIQIGAATGAIALDGRGVTPLQLGYNLDVNLADTDGDARVSWSELAKGAATNVLAALMPTGATLAGTVALQANLFDNPATEATDYKTEGELARLSFELDTTTSLDVQVQSEGSIDLLSQLRQMSVDDFLALARDVIARLQGNSTAGLLDVDLPLVGRSLNDIVDFGESLLAALDEVVSQFNITDIRGQLDRVQTAIVNLPIAPEDKVQALDAVSHLRGLLAHPTVDVASAAFLSSVVAYVGGLEAEVRRLFDASEPAAQNAGPTTAADNPLGPIEQELQNEIDALKRQLPTVNDIGNRIARAVRGVLPNQDGLTVHFDIVPDADPAPGNQPAAVLGLQGTLAVVDQRFDPVIGPNSLGPISVDLMTDGELSVVADFGVGLALVLGAGGPVPMVITEEVAGNSNIVPTQLDVSVRGEATGSASVRFGSLDLLNGSAELAIGEVSPTSERAAITVDFGGGSGPIGATPLDSLTVTAQTSGRIAGHLDVSGLGLNVPNAVSIDIPLNDIAGAQVHVNEEALSGLFDGLDFDLRTIVDGISEFLDLLADELKNDLSKIPVIGGGLDDLGGLLSGLRDKLVEPLREELESIGLTSFAQVEDRIATFLASALSELFDQIASAAEPGLAPAAESFIDPDDIDVDVDSNHFQIRFKNGLKGMIPIANLPFDSRFNGLPMSAGVSADFNLIANLNYVIDLGFGVDRVGGFYLVPSDGDGSDDGENHPELSFSIDAGLTQGSSLEVDLFLLRVKATKEKSNSELEARVEIDLGDGERTYLPDLHFDAGISAAANLDLQLTAAPALNLPAVGANLVASWGINLGTVSEPVSEEPSLALNDITVDLGDFFKKYISPTLDTLHDAIEPIAPILDFLDADVPGLSQLAQMAGQAPITFLDLALLEASPEDAAAASKFVSVLRGIKDVAEVINNLTQGNEDGLLHFGSISVTGDGLNTSGWNLSALSSDGETGELSPQAEGDTIFDLSELSSTADALAGLNNDVDNALSKITTAPSDVEEEDDGLGIELPILDPQNVIRLLLGQIVDVVTWDIPHISLGFGWGQKFPVLPFPPISVEVGLNLEFTLDLFVGLDTRGLQTGNFFEGFYFGDRENGGTGEDIDEAVFQLGVSLAALLDVGVASAGVEGEIIGRLRANWRDPDEDGKLYLDELAESLNHPECLFDLTADMRVVIRLVWEILFASGSIDVIDLTVFEIDNKGLCPPTAPAHVSDGTPVDERDYRNTLPVHLEGIYGDDVTEAPAGTLILHAGSFADLRTRGNSSDTSETYTLDYLAPGVVEVEGMGLSARYGGVERILFDGGIGDDRINLRVNGDEEKAVMFPIPIYATGGAGNDILRGGMKADKLFGDRGEDVIDAGPGSDEIHGGDDNDTLFGGDGSDTIFGDGGDDHIDGNGGADNIEGGLGNDMIYGWNSPGLPHGNGSDGGDTISGNEGSDTVYGGPGNDTIFGNGNNDNLYGESGSDIIDGGDGHDLIEGGEGDDPWLHGGLGNDLIIGGPGSDSILGGWGKDALVAHMVGIGSVGGAQYSDYIEGGPDDDFICGSDGNDIIIGGTGDLGYQGLPERGILGVPFPIGPPFPVEPGGYTMESCLQPAPDELGPAAPGALAGGVFRDHNGDGVQGLGEAYEQGWTILVRDADGRALTTLETDASGFYQIDGLDPGTYRLVLQVPRGGIGLVDEDLFKVTTPGGREQLVVVSSDGTVEPPAFGVVRKPIIRGTIWNDLNGDGQRTANEMGQSNIRVYLDLNGNGVYDPADDFRAEPGQNSVPDDPTTPENEAGQFEFILSDPGQYFVRQTVPTSPTQGTWIQTHPETQVVYESGFSGSADAAWGGGTTDVSPGGTSLLGPFGNNPVSFQLDDLDPHTQVLVEFDLYIIGLWDGNDPVSPDRWRMTVTGIPNNVSQVIDASFSNIDTPGEFGSTQSYPDMYVSSNPTPYPAREGDVPERRDDLGYADPAGHEVSTLYRISRVVPHNLNQLRILFAGLTLDTDSGENWAIDNFRVTLLDPGHAVEVDWEDVIDVDFGNHLVPLGSLGQASAAALASAPLVEASASAATPTVAPNAVDPTMWIVTGTKWHDRDGDGMRDDGEEVLPGVTVFVDINGNSVLDDGEPSAVTRSDGTYEMSAPLGTVTIREVVPEGWEPTYPAARPLAITSDGRLAEIDFNNTFGDGIIHVRDLETIGGPVTKWIGITAQPSTGLLFAIGTQHDEDDPTEHRTMLFRIDPDSSTAEPLFALPEELAEGDLAFGPADPSSTGDPGEALYAMYRYADGIPQLVRIDLTDGSMENVGSLPISELVSVKDPSAMAFDAAGGLWILDKTMANTALMIRLDLATFAVTTTKTLIVHDLGEVSGMVLQPGSNKLLIVAGDPVDDDEPPRAYVYDVATDVLEFRGTHSLPLSGLALAPNIGYITTVVTSIPPAVPRRFDFGNLAVTEIPDGKDHIEGHGGKDEIYGDNHIEPEIVESKRLRLLGDADTLFGGAGPDIIYGDLGDDHLWGADDHDADIGLHGDDDSDTLDGGDGYDTVHQMVNADQSLHDDKLTGQGPDELSWIESAELIAGSMGFDLNASAFTLGGVTLVGGAGPDTLTGTDNDDILDGGLGSDRMFGRDGDDVYVFRMGMGLGQELDQVNDSDGFDTLDFSALPKTYGIVLNLGSNVLLEDGVRRLTTARPVEFEQAIGGAGNDHLIGSSGANWLAGGPGRDTLEGGGGRDVLNGGTGNDLLLGGGGDDVYVFGPASAGEVDEVDDSSGYDTLDFSSSGAFGLVVDMGSANLAVDDRRQVHAVGTLGSFESAIGTPNDDTFIDSSASEVFEGGDGDDRYVFGDSAARDTIIEFPGGGNDTIDFSPRTFDIFVDLGELTSLAFSFNPITATRVTSALGLSGFIENAVGGAGNDSLIGSPAANRLEGGPGNDILNGGGNADIYVFGDTQNSDSEADEIIESNDGSTNVLDFSTLTQDVTVMLSSGMASHGSRTVDFASNAFREVWAGSGDDTLIGSSANDRLVGGPGNDLLDGGFGNDTLIGGADDDTYRFSPLFFVSPRVPIVENDSIIDPDLELNADGSIRTNALGQPIPASGGEDTLDFSLLTAATISALQVNLASPLVAFHLDPRNSASVRFVSQYVDTFALENVIGSGANDVILGNDRNNALSGGPGNDTLVGNRGNDWLYGGAGTNTLVGGPHDDTYAFEWFASSADRIVEGPGNVGNGLLTPGGYDTIDLIGSLIQLDFDLAHFTPTMVPTEWDPGVTANTRIDLHDDSGPAVDDATRNGMYFENVLFFIGGGEGGARGGASPGFDPVATPEAKPGAITKEKPIALHGMLAPSPVLVDTVLPQTSVDALEHDPPRVLLLPTVPPTSAASDPAGSTVRASSGGVHPRNAPVRPQEWHSNQQLEMGDELLSILSISRARQDEDDELFEQRSDLVFAGLPDDPLDPLGYEE